MVTRHQLKAGRSGNSTNVPPQRVIDLPQNVGNGPQNEGTGAPKDGPPPPKPAPRPPPGNRPEPEGSTKRVKTLQPVKSAWADGAGSGEFAAQTRPGVWMEFDIRGRNEAATQ